MGEIKSVYKIRRRSDGLYSAGGLEPRFNRIGKSWPSIGALRGHLTMVAGFSMHARKKDNIKTFYSDCDVITYTVSPSEVEPVTEFTKAK